MIRQAVQILRAGGVVAFATETVYGLGADATNAEAVSKIFRVKGRPSTNPLIVHVSDASVARRYVLQWPDRAQTLADKFWPGPLTLVLSKHPSIVESVTANLASVGLRSPDHPLALALLKEFDGPLAAPSANRSTRISPTTAQHVRQELRDDVDLILDGGPCRIGIESTVLDLSRQNPAILRPGAITRQQIEAIIGPVSDPKLFSDVRESASSPGQQALHYSPTTPAFRFSQQDLGEVETFLKRHSKSQVVLLTLPDGVALSRLADYLDRIKFVTLPCNPVEYARRFYAALREADVAGIDAIWIEEPPQTAEWDALRDRIYRATHAAVRAV